MLVFKNDDDYYNKGWLWKPTDVHVPFRMNCNHAGDPLTYQPSIPAPANVLNKNGEDAKHYLLTFQGWEHADVSI